ncbi:MAG: sulfite exporter TauE/SafE family protein, partial [Spirochaetales bacterium]
RFLVPAIPDHVATLGVVVVTRETLIMVIFALTMLVAAVAMIRGCIRCVTRSEESVRRTEHQPLSIPSIAIEGLVVGTITGLVGAGGGFLIIPALVIIGGLPMRQAVGTSLVIIAVKSLVGFSGDLAATTEIAWGFLLTISAATVAGIVLGMIISRTVESARLRPIFGWFVLGMGAFITIQQVVSASAL